MSRLRTLVDKLYAFNKAEGYDTNLVLAKRKPALKMAALQDGVYHSLSPYLIELYSYVEHWEEAFFSQDILSLAMIDNARHTDWIEQNIQGKLKNFITPPGGGYDLSKISIFACSKVDSDETYLLWEGGVEPRVLRYFGADFEYFDDVIKLFEFFEEVADL